MGISKNKRITKNKGRNKVKKSKKFDVVIDSVKASFTILGRSPFNSGAKKIKVNQDPAKGAMEDRRHVLHYDEVLKPLVERVLTALYQSMGKDPLKVAEAVRQSMENAGLKRLPKSPDKIFERLVTEINSAPDNLIPDRADTNKAIEVVRGYLRSYMRQIATETFAHDCLDDNTGRMKEYRGLARKVFVCDNDGGEITAERNRIHGEILGFIDGCRGPAELWLLLHDMVHSVTFDFSPKITRDYTSKALDWQKKMRANIDSDPHVQLKDLMSLLTA